MLTDRLVPPLGVFFTSGCNADLLINIALTILGYFPGHIHGFYIEYQYFARREVVRKGGSLTQPAPGVYGAKVNWPHGRRDEEAAAPPAQGYGTMT